MLLPPLDLLERSSPGAGKAADSSATLLLALDRLSAPCALERVQHAPQATRYLLRPAEGLRMRAFDGLERDLGAALRAQTVRVVAPMPGTALVAVEVSRADRSSVLLGDVVSASSAPLSAAIGVDVDGEVVVFDIASWPHGLLAGTTGSGKSTLIHSLLAALTTVSTPDDLEILLCDPKRNELVAWEDMPHVTTIAYDPMDCVDLLWGCVETMEAVYQVEQDYRVRSLPELNAHLASVGERTIPHRLIVCDETSDLVMTARGRVESAMVRLGQLGRAAGFSVILATQSPRREVIRGILKANLPARVCLSTSSALESRIVLDRPGAETLLGRGDCLLDDGKTGTLRRMQVAYTSPADIEALVSHWTHESDTVEMDDQYVHEPAGVV